MYYLFALMVFAYLISYFYLQSDEMVKKKAFDTGSSWLFFVYHVGHGILHLLLWMLAGLFFLYTIRLDLLPDVFGLSCVGLIVSVLHVLTDICTQHLHIKFKKNNFCIFILGQLVHVVFILAGILLLSNSYGFVVTKSQLDIITPILHALMVLIGLAFLMKPTSIIVMLFLELSMREGGVKKINITRSHLAKIFDDKFNREVGDLVTKKNLAKKEVNYKINLFKRNTDLIIRGLSKKRQNLQVDVSEIFPTNNAGKWIGYIERLMIFIFYLSGQFTAIAAVMAIKTAFRFNDLKDDNDSQRSEYIMLGTFSSLFITIITSVCVKHFMDINHFKEIISLFRTTFMQ